MSAFKAAAAVTDPLDFRSTRVPRLLELDALLRCHICKEFMVAPMLTSCGHSFCSMCVRKYLLHTPQCPICSKELRESYLSRNVLLEQVVMAYKDVRPDLLEQLSPQASPTPKEDARRSTPEVINVEELDDLSGDDELQILEEHTTKKRKPQGKSIDVLFKRQKVPEKRHTVNVGTCPICQKKLPLSELESTHIDRCLSSPAPEGTATSSDPPSRPRSSSSMTLATQVQSATSFQPKESKQIYQKLAKLDFASLSSAELKSKLGKLELSTQGTRSQLESRYNEYLILWNANCDSIAPRDPKVLRRQLSQWEGSLKFKVSGDKGLDKEGWKLLISQAKANAERSKTLKKEESRRSQEQNRDQKIDEDHSRATKKEAKAIDHDEALTTSDLEDRFFAEL